MEQKKLSVVIPLFNEAENIELLYQELIPILHKLVVFNDFEIILVNDGSSDDSLVIVKKMAQHDARVKVISFTRNFGHEYATYAGLINATGEAVVLMDADRQDPPELIFEFEQLFKKGIHIAFGQRTKRLRESWLKKITSKCFYPFFKYLTRVDMPADVGDFCLLSRRAVDMIKELPERAIFIRGLIYWLGLSKQAVPFVRRERGAGVTKYNYRKLTIFALENIISFSTVPIYWLLFFSLGVIGFCGIGLFMALCMRCFGHVIMTGWTSLMMVMLFLSATILFSLSILGLYIGKIFQEIKGRPVFLIDEKINFDIK